MAFLAPFIALADTITKSFGLQGTVMFSHCIGSDPYGPIYADPVALQAVIMMKDQQVRGKDGILQASRGQVTFLDLNAVVAATAPDGRIRDIDIVTVPGWPPSGIIAMGGFVDVTGIPVATDVWLG